MHREHPKGMTGYCLDVLRNETSQPNRYQINRTGYHGFAQASGCRYFNMMAELYDTLEALHQLHVRSEEHTSELQSLMRISYAVFCLKKKTNKKHTIIQQYVTNR